MVKFAQQRAVRIEGLVTHGVGIGDDGVDDDRLTVLVVPGGVAAEDHRQAVRWQAGAAERPDVMVVE